MTLKTARQISVFFPGIDGCFVVLMMSRGAGWVESTEPRACHGCKGHSLHPSFRKEEK